MFAKYGSTRIANPHIAPLAKAHTDADYETGTVTSLLFFPGGGLSA